MDPQATWNAMLEAWRERNWCYACECAATLHHWLSTHGFPPEVFHPRSADAELNSVIAEAASRFILQRSREILDAENGISAGVPFSLTCALCLQPGPNSYQESIQEGWTEVQYVPEAESENFLGVCPVCRNAEN